VNEFEPPHAKHVDRRAAHITVASPQISFYNPFAPLALPVSSIQQEPQDWEHHTNVIVPSKAQLPVSKLTCAALGAGLREPNKKMKVVLPTIIESADDSSADVTASNIELNSTDPELSSSDSESQVPSDSPTHSASDPTSIMGGATKQSIKLDINISESGFIGVKLHLFEGISHRIFHSDGTVAFDKPTCAPCQRIGKVRYKIRVPQHSAKSDLVLNTDIKHDIVQSYQDYDGLNGQANTTWSQFTDAFADPAGHYAQCQTYWSVVNNAFQHEWSDTNIYAFPPMQDDIILKTLQFHCVQQSKAQSKDKSFRGIYIVPYRPHSKYWKYVSNFQLLKYYPAGSSIYSAPAKQAQGKLKPMITPQAMCVLYDPGYSSVNLQGAYLHALEKCADALLESEWDWNMLDAHDPMSSFENTNDGEVDISNHEHESEFDGQISNFFELSNIISDTTPYFLPEDCVLAHISECIVMHDRGKSLPTDSAHDALHHVRCYNMTHCQANPSTMAGQFTNVHKASDVASQSMFRSIRSAGNLTTILEQDEPDWAEVDQAIHGYVRTLQDAQQAQQDNDEQQFDPQMFSKTWLEGGLLPIHRNSLFNISTPDDLGVDQDDLCLVVKTKVVGNVNNTALVDEGANRSVLNVDWYENKGIDWRTLFNISSDMQPGIIYMADQHPVSTYGVANISIELRDTGGKTFTHPFQLMSLGKHNYAQILGFDWKLKYHTRTSLPEYTIEARKLGCTTNGYPMPIRLYQMHYKEGQELPGCEDVSPLELSKEIKLLSARLRRMHVYIPPQAFIRQIIVRPAAEEDDASHMVNLAPDKWTIDSSLEERAAILRQRIANEYRTEYADVLDCEPKGINTKMPHKHVIEVIPGAKPYAQKIKRHSPLEMDLIGKYIKEMLEGGRIRASDSPWGADVLFVPKPDGSFRCCQDYRELNKVIKHDTYPLPRIDVHMDMAQGVFWSKMDLLKGFYQLPMDPDSIQYTAFNTLLGKFEFLVMPMGLQSAPGSFMRAMNAVFDGLLWDPNLRQDCGVLVYLDDILIFSQTEDQHMHILKLVLERLRKFGLQCRFDKCSFAVTEIEYLGFKLSHMGVRMDPRKVEILKN
jgi:Reverse transcriptase (RNA-dependent DNA polymerase)